jgi:hypothetical protein
MTFAEHITTNVFLPRLNDRRILVVYDEHKRFEEICASFASAQCRVIFTGKRPVSSRQEAMERWKEMAGDTTYQSQMLIYCQDPAPKDNGERQQPDSKMRPRSTALGLFRHLTPTAAFLRRLGGSCQFRGNKLFDPLTELPLEQGRV